MSIKTVYFHIKGTPLNTTDDMHVKKNYMMANLDYTKGVGYTWSIRPIGQYTTRYDDGDILMNTISFGLFSETPDEIYRECLVKCQRKGKVKEREAIELFDSNVTSAIINRLGYDIDLERS